ncbi:hypothetical protein NQF87_01580 [Bombella sp. TMW 2.2559]|uniref:Rap1a immunity protein domain-containing protein n=1 Tax=Bombella dulcis TaxID=2967339 RepID=A0ABT3WCY9_9PROT|nr:Rap1a/Tai family immunity protein [Bombella dulcis]MCX5615674.1 hypothetical protein [Bombella dulcis]
MKLIRQTGRVFLLGMVCMFLGTTAHAQRISSISGVELGDLCRKESKREACGSYLAGVMDGAAWSQSFGSLVGSRPATAFCLPAGIKGAQVRALMVGWLAGHEAVASQPAGRAVYQALHDNYACPTGMAGMYVEQHAEAQSISSLSGRALVSMCTHENGLLACDGYLAGTMDSEVWARNYSTVEGVHMPVAFCVPKEVRGSQLRALVVGWYAGHDDALNEPAGRGIYRALRANYPCSSTIQSIIPLQSGGRR